MGEAIKIIFIIILVYAFSGLLAFFPFLFGLLHNIFYFPLNFIDTNFYPMSSLPYFILVGSGIFIISFFIIRLFNKE